jgi:hypothetical protein
MTSKDRWQIITPAFASAFICFFAISRTLTGGFGAHGNVPLIVAFAAGVLSGVILRTFAATVSPNAIVSRLSETGAVVCDIFVAVLIVACVWNEWRVHHATLKTWTLLAGAVVSGVLIYSAARLWQIWGRNSYEDQEGTKNED